MKKLIFGVLTLSALGIVSLPAYAGGDSATIQDSRQTTYQTGSDNYSGQSSIQKTRTNQRGYSDGNTGEVQNSDQLSDQYGHGNTAEQRVRQESTRKNRGSERRSCDWGCD
jgi:hypothetical protein